MESARAMMFAAQLSKGFWGEAVVTACYLKNRVSHRGLEDNKTPHEIWFKSKPHANHLRVFGCRATVWIPAQLRTKLEPKAWTRTMVGYSDYLGWRIWDLVTQDSRVKKCEVR